MVKRAHIYTTITIILIAIFASLLSEGGITGHFFEIFASFFGATSIGDTFSYHSTYVDSVYYASHAVKWSAPVGEYIFSWTGGEDCDTWINYTFTQGPSVWTNVTKIIPEGCVGNNLLWRIYAHDGSEWSASGIEGYYVEYVPHWSLGAPINSSNYEQHTSKVLLDSKGVLHAFWYDEDPNGARYAYYSFYNGSWSEPEVFAANLPDKLVRILEVFNLEGELHVLFEYDALAHTLLFNPSYSSSSSPSSSSTSNTSSSAGVSVSGAGISDIYESVRNSSGWETQSPATDHFSNIAGNRQIFSATVDDTAHIVYEGQPPDEPGSSALYYLNRTSNGWSQLIELYRTSNSLYDIKVTHDEERLYIFFVVSTPTSPPLRAIRGVVLNFTSFIFSEFTLSPEDCSDIDYTEDVVAYNGELHILARGGSNLYYVRGSPGSGWECDSLDLSFIPEKIAFNKTNTLILGENYSLGQLFCAFNSNSNSNSTWLEEKIHPAEFAEYNPKFAVGENAIYTLYEDSTSGLSQIYYTYKSYAIPPSATFTAIDSEEAIVGSPIRHYAEWDSAVSCYVFSWTVGGECKAWIEDPLAQAQGRWTTVRKIIPEKCGGKTIRWKISANSSEGMWGQASGSYYVNHPPYVGKPVVTPAIPYTTSLLNCSVYVEDSDDSPLYVYFQWYKDEVALGGEDRVEITSSGLAYTEVPITNPHKYSTYKCSVRVYDGHQQSEWRDSDPVTVQNQAPTELELLLTPTTVYSDDDLFLSVRCLDPDDEDLDIRVQWYMGEELVKEENRTFTGVYFTNISYLNHTLTQKNQSWHVDVYCSDGDYELKMSRDINVRDSKPTTPLVRISEPDKDEFTSCEAFGSFDADSDPFKYNYYINTSDPTIEVVHSNTFDCPSYCKRNLTIYCWARAVGSSLNSSMNVSSATYQNTPPKSIVSLRSEDGLNRTGSSLITEYSFLDLDSDTIISRQVLWYKNGILQPDLSDREVVTSGNTSKNDLWVVSVRGYDSFGWGEWTNRSLKILNTPPQVPIIIKPENESQLSSNVTQFIFSSYDADSDNLSYFIILDNRTYLVTESETMLNVSDGTHSVYVIVTDGESNSSASEPVSFDVDTTGPFIKTFYVFPNIVSGGDAGENIDVRVDVGGNSIASVSLILEGSNYSKLMYLEDFPYYGSISTAELYFGEYNLTLLVEDSYGNTASDVRTVTVSRITNSTLSFFYEDKPETVQLEVSYHGTDILKESHSGSSALLGIPEGLWDLNIELKGYLIEIYGANITHKNKNVSLKFNPANISLEGYDFIDGLGLDTDLRLDSIRLTFPITAESYPSRYMHTYLYAYDNEENASTSKSGAGCRWIEFKFNYSINEGRYSLGTLPVYKLDRCDGVMWALLKEQVCGDGIADSNEDYSNCCGDVGCPEHYICLKNACLHESVAFPYITAIEISPEPVVLGKRTTRKIRVNNTGREGTLKLIISSNCTACEFTYPSEISVKEITEVPVTITIPPSVETGNYTMKVGLYDDRKSFTEETEINIVKCLPGQKQCFQNTLKICENETWVYLKECEYECVSGRCEPPSCKPNTITCNGTALITCNKTGNGYTVEFCEEGCKLGDNKCNSRVFLYIFLIFVVLCLIVLFLLGSMAQIFKVLRISK